MTPLSRPSTGPRARVSGRSSWVSSNSTCWPAIAARRSCRAQARRSRMVCSAAPSRPSSAISCTVTVWSMKLLTSSSGKRPPHLRHDAHRARRQPGRQRLQHAARGERDDLDAAARRRRHVRDHPVRAPPPARARRSQRRRRCHARASRRPRPPAAAASPRRNDTPPARPRAASRRPPPESCRRAAAPAAAARRPPARGRLSRSRRWSTARRTAARRRC